MTDYIYLTKRLASMNYRQFFQRINGIHQKTGIPRFSIFHDMKDCAMKYGAGYMDYDLFEMYNLTDEQKNTYLTRGRNNQLMIMLDKKEYWHYFENKDEFYTKFEPFLGRSWLKIDPNHQDTLKQWIYNHPDFITKPINESCGHGVEKIHLSDFSSIDDCIHYLVKNQKGVVEEILVQDPQMASLHPASINTIRVVTIFYNDIVHIIYTCIRIGNFNKPVDNFNNDGLTSPVDIKTGIVLHPAIDKKKKLYEVHPITHVAVQGFQVPYWQEMMAMIEKCARKIPEMAYVGWDVAMSKSGPVLIEGNNFPGHDVYQLPVHTPDHIGMYPKFLDAIKKN